ncbi:MAG: single-stranded DNA-binding protein [Clostridium perfringens]|nr:single-stranded DNA-binding protein [Clostridium perfringens]
MNKVVLIGRLTKDPELRFAAGSGTAVARFTLAVNRQAVSGNIRTGSYEAQDGTRRYTTDVVVESFDFIDSGNGGARGNSGFGSGNDFGGSFGMPDNSFSDSSFNSNDDMTPIDDGDIPF